MKTPSGLPVTAAHRTLTRLRWLLTITFTVTSAAGLLLFAWLAVRADAERGRQDVDGQLTRVTLGAIQNLLDLRYDAVSTQQLAARQLSKECPGFIVVPGTGTNFIGLQSSGNCPLARLSSMNALAIVSTRDSRLVRGYGPAASGDHRMRMVAEPFRVRTSNGQVAVGAVVAAADLKDETARHRRVVLFATIGSAVLIFGLGAGSHYLSGRAMRPAAGALEQQELFLAESAHDLRTPVAALRALAETALDNPNQRDVLLPRTVSLAQRMGNIIEDLLVRARLAAGVAELNLQPVRLDQLVANVVDQLPTASADQVEIWTDACAVRADTPLLQRAVGNLIDNALKYGKHPGELARIDVTVVEGRVRVRDHGPGLDGAAVARTRARTSGSAGLGLSIVRWVAETHDGRLTSGNDPEGGAVFELTLPVIRP